MKSAFLRASFMSAALLFGNASIADPAQKPQFGNWGFDLSAMDTAVKPGDDFNRYANGAWLDGTPIPPDKAIISLRMLMSDRIELRLHDIMEQCAADADARRATLDGKVGAFYKAFMDEDRIEKLGATPIDPQLTAIRGVKDRMGLAALMGRTTQDFEGSLFSITEDVDLKHVNRYAIYLSQAGLGMPDRDYYLQASFAPQKAAYQAYVTRILSLVGWPQAEAQAAAVVEFETRVAQASWTKVEQRDQEKTYNPVSLAQLAVATPKFDWKEFLTGAGLDHVDRLIVAENTAFPRIAAAYAATPLDVLKAWMAFTVADNAAFYLSAPFTQARFEFRDKTLAGQPQQAERWKRAIHAVSGADCTGDRVDCFGNMGFGVGQLYTAQYFPPSAKAKIEALVIDLKAAMRVRLEALDWMSPVTKKQALRKLDTYQIKVGYPDHLRDYSALQIRADDLIGDVLRAAHLDWDFYRGRLQKPVDRADWSMTPQTNDAYNGNLRDIVFPAGILQPPIFDAAADPAVNYGAIGGVIGHELTHGFDDAGRKLDAEGKLRDWWSASDAKAFEARAKTLSAQYSLFEPVQGSRIKGDLTLGENIADLGGVNIALEAYRRSLQGRPAPQLDGFTGEQRLFLGWAQAWRGKANDDYLRKQMVSDPHSPRGFRVIGPVRNVDAWYSAFDVKSGDKYYLAPDERVRIW